MKEQSQTDGPLKVLDGKDNAVEIKKIHHMSYPDVKEILQYSDEAVADVEMAIVFVLNNQGFFRIRRAGTYSKTNLLGALELIKRDILREVFE